MARAKDPTLAIKSAAADLPNVTVGSSCNQTSFKTGKSAFLYIGPGPKGVGFKAMFKLRSSLREAKNLAESQPERFEIGVGNWVATRFSSDAPLPKMIWNNWLKESYANATTGGAVRRKALSK